MRLLPKKSSPTYSGQKKLKLKRPLLILGLLLACVAAGGWWYQLNQEVGSLTLVHRMFALNEEASLAVSKKVVEYSNLQKNIQEIISKSGGDFGVYVEDLTTGVWMGHQESKKFQAASVIKVPLVLYLYGMALDSRLSLDETIEIAKEDMDGGTGVLQHQPLGSRYTLRQLAKHAIEDSDNVATNMLIRRVGRANFYYFLKLAGVRVLPTGQGPGNNTSARDMGLFLRGVLVLKEMDPKAGDEILGYLIQSKYNDRIPAGVPSDIKVANKIGTQVDTINDVAIVLLPERPYILSVLSNHPDEDLAVKVLTRISEAAYSFHKNLR